jgi:hypothetical protein
MPMAEVEYHQTENIKSSIQHPRVDPSAEKRRFSQKLNRSEPRIRRIINISFSAVYWLFATIYLLDYSNKLFKAYEDGFKELFKSKEFWEFQRDLLVFITIYFVLLMTIKLLIFKR